MFENNKEVVRPSRRDFLKYSGATMAVAGLIVAGCGDDDPEPMKARLGAGDTGVLNYAYALEQLEAAFYTAVMATPYANMSSSEMVILEDLRKHEVAHREFLKAAIGNDAIPALEVDFSSIDFSDRASVLGAAKTFEDLGVSAYNGAGRLLMSADLLTIAGKIVSVEARHAAAIRSILDSNPRSFAGDDIVTTDNGLDVVRTPAEVLQAAASFIVTEIDASQLPS
ncbi:MAG: ferritin-like domain-containing protein [Catalinimonas sp.]